MPDHHPSDTPSGSPRGRGELVDRMLESSRDCIQLLDLDGRLLSINDAGCRLLDIKDPRSLLGTHWPDWWQGPHKASAQNAITDARGGHPRTPYEAFAHTSAGNPKWWEVSVTPVARDDGALTGILVVSRDITERRQAELLLQGQNRALELVASGVPLSEVLNCLARIIEEQSGGAAIASIFLIDRDGQRLRVGAAPSLPASFNQAVDGITIQKGLGTCADAAARAAITLTPDIAAAAGWKGLAHLPLEQGLKAAWSMPILSSKGTVLGTIGTYFRDTREPTHREKQVVEGLCRTAALAIERRAAEETARQSRERSDLVVRAAQVGLWYCPLPFGTLVWDETVKDHFHLAPDADVTIDIFYERIHPDDREPTRAAITHAIDNNTFYDIDYRTLSVDGSRTKWIRAMGRVFRDAQGVATRFDGVTVDVTDRKLAEESLRTSAEALRRHVDTLATLNQLNLSMASTSDIQAVVQNATDAATRLTRAAFGAFFYNLINERGESYTLYTISGVPRSAFEKFPMPRNTAVFAPTFAGEGVVRSDDITQDPRYGHNAPHRGMPAGHLPVRSYLAVPVKSRSGETIGGLFFGHPNVAVFDDEAERYAVGIAAQAAVAFDNARLYANLRQSDERYRLVSRATNDAIWDWDLSTDRVGWNHALAERFGHAEAAANGTTAAWWIDHIHPDDRPRVADSIHAVIDDPRSSHWDSEYRFQRADGSWADVYDRGTVLRDPSGKPLRMVGAMLDVSDRKRGDRERHQLLESERSARSTAEQAGRLKDEFLATLSHELRTPLNAILGWAHLLRKGMSDPATLQRGIEVIDRNARAQTQLIADLLDISRITTGKMRLDVQRVELPLIIEAALESVRPAADAKEVRIQSVVEPVADVVHGDPARLQQVVWNLVSNAVKFTPRGGRVQVILARVNSHIELSVSDTGRGIKPEFLPFVFERFRQADSSTAREHGGLGLGLAIVKQLVDLHGGAVRVVSAGEGQGSTFTVHLPLAVVHRPAFEDQKVHPKSISLSPIDADLPRLTGVRVLVVDDEPDARELIQRLLLECEAQVILAASADEALIAIGKERFDVILSDIGMPERDGYSLMEAVRRGGCRIPAAALTAFARSEDRTRALSAGYQTHIAKPVEPAELLATVASLAHRIR